MTSQDSARVVRSIRGMPTSDGAGVRLTRVIGTPSLPELDPFLMLDEFGTDRAEDYIAGSNGFPGNQVFPVHNTYREAGHIVVPFTVEAGHFCRFTAQKGTA